MYHYKFSPRKRETVATRENCSPACSRQSYCTHFLFLSRLSWPLPSALSADNKSLWNLINLTFPKAVEILTSKRLSRYPFIFIPSRFEGAIYASRASHISPNPNPARKSFVITGEFDFSNSSSQRNFNADPIPYSAPSCPSLSKFFISCMSSREEYIEASITSLDE